MHRLDWRRLRREAEKEKEDLEQSPGVRPASRRPGAMAMSGISVLIVLGAYATSPPLQSSTGRHSNIYTSLATGYSAVITINTNILLKNHVLVVA